MKGRNFESVERVADTKKFVAGLSKSGSFRAMNSFGGKGNRERSQSKQRIQAVLDESDEDFLGSSECRDEGEDERGNWFLEELDTTTYIPSV